MAFVASSQAFQGGTGGLVINKPTGTASGDLIILGMTGYQVTFTLPSGFTLGDDRSIGGPDGQSLMWAYKVAGGSEPSSYTVTINSGFEPTAFLMTISGRDGTTPVTAQSYTSNTSSNASPITLSLTGVTAATGDDVVIIYAGDTTAAADRWSGAPPASYTERIDYDPQDWSGIYSHTRENVSSGATGTLQPTLTRTVGSGGAGWLGFVIALKAAAGATAYSLNAETGSYSVSGVSASLVSDRAINAATGSYSVSGVSATTVRDISINAATGSYSVSGVSASLISDRMINAATGSYSIIGTDATLQYTPVGNYEINAETGVYSVTGVNALTVADRSINSATGAYSVTGVSASVLADRAINAATGSYSVTGVSATLLHELPAGVYVLNAETGNYAITGYSTTLLAPAKDTGAGSGGYNKRKKWTDEEVYSYLDGIGSGFAKKAVKTLENAPKPVQKQVEKIVHPFIEDNKIDYSELESNVTKMARLIQLYEQEVVRQERLRLEIEQDDEEFMMMIG